jgi:hypothetical protein
VNHETHERTRTKDTKVFVCFVLFVFQTGLGNSTVSTNWYRFILGETWLYNLLLPDHSPVIPKTFRSAGLLSSASKSVKRSRYALKRCPRI